MPPTTRRVLFPALAVLAALGACTGNESPTEPASRAEPASSGAPSSVVILFHNVWGAKPDLPSPRFGLAAAAVGKTIYVMGGFNEVEQPLATVRAWDVSAGSGASWVAKASMPGKRGHTNGATAIGGRIYVPGGTNATGGKTRTLFVYDPAADTWATRAPMPAAGSGGGSVALDGKLYVVTRTAAKSVSSLFRYNPATNVWSKRPDAPVDLTGAVLGEIDGKLYAAGKLPELGVATTEVYMYNPATNEWSEWGSLSVGHGFATGKAIGGKLYVVGGTPTGVGHSARLDVYNSANDSWTQKADMPTASSMAASAVVDGILYVLGGLGQGEVLRKTAGYLP